MDEADEQIPHLGPILRPVEQSIFAMQNGFLQGTDVMPPPGLCRVGSGAPLVCEGCRIVGPADCRHNHRLTRKASSVSGGRKRTTLEGLACAKARSLSCM